MSELLDQMFHDAEQTEARRELARAVNSRQATTAEYLDEAVRRELAKGPIPKKHTENPEDLKLLAHCMRPQESIQEFVARTGLSASEARARNMTSEEISKFVAQAETNNASDPCAPSGSWQPKAIPSKFTEKFVM